MGMEIEVTRKLLDAIRAEADRAYPEECCGILFGPDPAGPAPERLRIETALPAANVAKDRRGFFEIDPQALFDAHRAARQGGPAIIGYYHSHPTGPAGPSATDRAMAPGDGKVWAICGGGDISFWLDDGQGFPRLSYHLLDR